jgi:hypothetical protein
MSLRRGRLQGLTWPTVFRPGGIGFARLLFFAARHVSAVTEPLARMREIHFAHWILWTGSKQDDADPRMLFVSFFDTDLPQYIDDFAETMPLRFRAAWITAKGYPGLIPTDRFSAWVDTTQATRGHLWCAYPMSTTSVISSATELMDRVDAAAPELLRLDDDEFARRFDELAGQVQRCL